MQHRSPAFGGLKHAQYAVWIIVGFTLFAFIHVTLNSLVDRRIDLAMSEHRMLSRTIDDGSSEPVDALIRPRKFNTQGLSEKPIAPISLIIPCQSEDFYLLPMLLESLANQTMFPQETLVVLNLPPNSSNGTTLLSLDFEFDKLRKQHDSLFQEAMNLPKRKTDKKVAGEYVIKSRVPVEWSLLEIPNLKLLLRSGKFYAGSNRMFGARAANNQTEFISFFDCDDYLHPKRTEYVYKTFQEHDDLEALIHGFSLVTFTQWDDQFAEFHKDMDYMPENKTFLWPYDTLWKSMPIEKFKNETNGEPRQTSDSLWFFPRDMKLPRYPPYPTMGHNAWITLKKKILDEVPYPETLPRGQDSLYNWRLLVSKKKWNHLPLRLAAYVRPR